MKHCTFITRHPTGVYYIGKGMTAKVLSGKYNGSGVDLWKMLKAHPKREWTTEVLGTFETADQAFKHERELVTAETVADPMCLNRTKGGRGGWQREFTQEHRQKLSEAAKRRVWTAEARANVSIGRRSWSYTPEQREVHASHLREMNIARKKDK